MEKIEIARMKNQVKRAKKVEKEIISMVVLMAQESMCPDSYDQFCQAMSYMADRRQLDLREVL